MGVCSGKLSEGIDFTDEMARMVILVGVPFPNIKDAGIKCKQQYLDQSKREYSKTRSNN
jgi:Fanconi anemia group J protein